MTIISLFFSSGTHLQDSVLPVLAKICSYVHFNRKASIDNCMIDLAWHKLGQGRSLVAVLVDFVQQINNN